MNSVRARAGAGGAVAGFTCGALLVVPDVARGEGEAVALYAMGAAVVGSIVGVVLGGVIAAVLQAVGPETTTGARVLGGFLSAACVVWVAALGGDGAVIRGLWLTLLATTWGAVLAPVVLRPTVREPRAFSRTW